ncbi:MAG: hypothetical protein ABIL18_06650, partial [candidate division WOR-3 bacterium]
MSTKSLSLIILPLLLLGAQWQSLNGPPAGRADDMCMGYDPYIPAWVIYAADQTHKLYKSTDEGELWQVPTQDDQVDNPVCVICEPNNAQVVYIGRDDGETQPPDPLKVVYKSEDGGINWDFVNQNGDITNRFPRCFAMDPTNSQIVYAGFHAGGGSICLYKTTNGGITWNSCGDFPQSVSVRDIYIKPDNPNILYVATSEGIKKSTDGGTNWSTLPAPPNSNDIYSLTINNDLPDPTLFVGNALGYDAWIYYTTDDGANWFLGMHTQSEYFAVPTGIAVEENQQGQIMYATFYEAGFYKSTDGGSSWNINNKGLVDLRLLSLLQHSANGSKIFVGGDRAIYIDYGHGWLEKTKGMKLVDINDVSALAGNICVTAGEVSQTIASKGINKSDDAGENWRWIYFDHGLKITDVE